MLLSIPFSHVSPAVGIQNMKVQKEFWKRFDPLPPSWVCFLSRAGFKRIWCHLMQRHCARRTIVVWHQSTARATENRRSTCFRITLAVLWCQTLIVCVVLLQVKHTDTFRHLLELQSTNFSPPPLMKSKIIQYKLNLYNKNYKIIK